MSDSVCGTVLWPPSSHLPPSSRSWPCFSPVDSFCQSGNGLVASVTNCAVISELSHRELPSDRDCVTELPASYVGGGSAATQRRIVLNSPGGAMRYVRGANNSCQERIITSFTD